MKFSLLIVTLVATNWLFGQDSISVLFIGNSYTYGNDLPSVLVSLSASKGDVVTVDSRTQGGATFATQASIAENYTKIHSKPWDYVVLQGQSQEPAFPDAQVNNASIPFAQQIADSIYASKYCTDLMLFMTWGYINGDAQWAPISTYDGMQARLRNAYKRIADSCEASVSPVGMAWKYTRENHPSINLYAGDGQHPSYEGSYLAACTFYASLFRKSPVGATFHGSLTPTVALQLQQAAEIVVLDSLAQWHLRPVENHTIANYSYSFNETTLTTINESWKAQSYEWDFGDGSTSTLKSPSHTYSMGGNYEIELTAMSECNSDVKSQYYDIPLEVISQLEQMNLILKKLESGLFEVTSTNHSVELLEEIQIFDVYGKKLNSITKTNYTVQIDLRNQSFATYYLTIGNVSVKLVY